MFLMAKNKSRLRQWNKASLEQKERYWRILQHNVSLFHPATLAANDVGGSRLISNRVESNANETTSRRKAELVEEEKVPRSSNVASQLDEMSMLIADKQVVESLRRSEDSDSSDDGSFQQDANVEVSKVQIYLWIKTENSDHLYHLWFKTFTAEQRLALWNSLELPLSYFKLVIKHSGVHSRLTEYIEKVKSKEKPFSYKTALRLLNSKDLY